MKTINIMKYAVPMLVLMVSACSEEKTYLGGEPDAPDCMGVYFDSENETDFLFIPGEPATATLKVHRLNASVAADVPIIAVSEAPEIVFPKSVHFDQGQKDSEFVVDFSALPTKKLVTFSIEFPSEYISKYADTNFDYKSTAIFSDWENANADGSKVKFYFTDNDYVAYYTSAVVSSCYQPVESEMQVLPGAGLIRVKDFLNSGVDMTFSIAESPYADFAGYYRISPVGNNISMNEAYESDQYGDSWYNAWFLLSDAEDDYVDANLVDLDGKDSVMEYPYFMWYSNSYSYEYSYMAVKGDGRKYNAVSIGMSGTCATNITLPANFYLFFRWDGESGL